MAPQEVSQQDVTIHQDYFYQMTEFLTDWHVRVTWVAFTVLWLLWAISWTLRHMFGGDAAATNYVDNTNATNTTATAAAANAPAAGTTDPETGAAAPGATTTTTNPNNPGGKLGFLGSPPAWGQNVYVSFTLCIFFLLQYPLIEYIPLLEPYEPFSRHSSRSCPHASVCPGYQYFCSWLYARCHDRCLDVSFASNN